MKVTAKKTIKIKVFLIPFILFMILFFVSDLSITILSRMRHGSSHVVILGTYKYLKDNGVPAGKPIPKSLSPVRIKRKEYYLEKIETFYYPEAWDKPGRILLKRKVGNFYTLLYGDGVISTVTYWYSSDSKYPNLKADSIRTDATKYMFGNFWLIPLVGIIILFTLYYANKKQG